MSYLRTTSCVRTDPDHELAYVLPEPIFTSYKAGRRARGVSESVRSGFPDPAVMYPILRTRVRSVLFD